MPSPHRQHLLSLLYQALGSPCGIRLSVSDVSQAKTHLTEAKKIVKDPDLRAISIYTSPNKPNEEVWLVRKAVKKPLDIDL